MSWKPGISSQTQSLNYPSLSGFDGNCLVQTSFQTPQLVRQRLKAEPRFSVQNLHFQGDKFLNGNIGMKIYRRYGYFFNIFCRFNLIVLLWRSELFDSPKHLCWTENMEPGFEETYLNLLCFTRTTRLEFSFKL